MVPRLFQSSTLIVCRHLSPGGQIEVSEARTRFYCDDDTFPADSALKFWEVRFCCRLCIVRCDVLHC